MYQIQIKRVSIRLHVRAECFHIFKYVLCWHTNFDVQNASRGGCPSRQQRRYVLAYASKHAKGAVGESSSYLGNISHNEKIRWVAVNLIHVLSYTCYADVDAACIWFDLTGHPSGINSSFVQVKKKPCEFLSNECAFSLTNLTIATSQGRGLKLSRLWTTVSITASSFNLEMYPHYGAHRNTLWGRFEGGKCV